MSSPHVLIGQWIARAENGEIVGAFDDRADGEQHYDIKDIVSLERVPEAVAARQFVWGVCTPDQELEGTYGGNAQAATARAEAIGGTLRMFLLYSPPSG